MLVKAINVLVGACFVPAFAFIGSRKLEEDFPTDLCLLVTFIIFFWLFRRAYKKDLLLYFSWGFTVPAVIGVLIWINNKALVQTEGSLLIAAFFPLAVAYMVKLVKPGKKKK